MKIDASLYPDWETPPARLEDPGAKADYLHRVCAAMDFQIFPEPATLKELAGWKDIFDRYAMPASPGYRALRGIFGLGAPGHPPGLAGHTPTVSGPGCGGRPRTGPL